MKFKQTHRSGGLVVEFSPTETQLPEAPAQHPEKSQPEFRLQKILVPVDFSDCSRKAMTYAASFARQFQSELVLLYVIAPYPPIPQMAPVDIESIEEARNKLETLRQTLSVNTPVTTLLRTGDPCIEINETARASQSDLIVLATHGRTGIAHALLGSTAEKVVRYATCPVLIVREHEHEFLSEASDAKDLGKGNRG